MEKEEFQKVVDFIEGYYHRKLEVAELRALKEQMKYFKNFKEFENLYGKNFIKKNEYFNVQKLCAEIEELEEFKKHLGIKDFNELYDN